MPPCTINQLSPELLIRIFEHVKQPKQPTSSIWKPSTIDPSIVACLLCCMTWHEIALPLLYRDIVLRDQNLNSFIQRCLSQPPRENNQHRLKIVRSLTVSVNAETIFATQGLTESQEEDDFENAAPQGLVLSLQELPAALSKMTNLTTFSLRIVLSYPHTFTEDIICPLLRSLPESCVNLELVLDDHFNRRATEGNHICQGIAKCLPRLHHLRLILDRLCPDVLGQGFSRSGSIRDETHFRVPTYPSLETLVISCGDAGTCDEDSSRPPDETDAPKPRAWKPLVQSLRELVLRGAFPNIERLRLLDGPSEVNRPHVTWYRRDIARNRTWAIPWTRLRARGSLTYLIRLPDGQELMTAARGDMADLAEGQTWRETITGTRLPAAISDGLEKGKHLTKPVPTISPSGYQRMYPGRSCNWWINDAATGTSTISAIEREGLMDTSPVLATAPPGWMWELADGIPGKLVREGSAT